MFGDIDAAEDLAQDALLAALEQWPRDGVPPNPGAWLMLTAKHRQSTGTGGTPASGASSRYWAPSL
jgi:predicted RNA polymerase sigma factor